MEEDERIPKSNNRKKIKEGFMVKKGHIRHNWKPRWFVLYEDGMSYYKSNRHPDQLNAINLRGCSIVSPCLEYTKKEHIFRLIEHHGREYLLQCNDEEERESWTAEVSAVIRSLEAISDEEDNCQKEEVCKECEQEPLHAKRESLKEKQISNLLGGKVSFEEVLEAMQDTDAGVPYGDHVINQTTFKLCFTGAELIDWLISWNFVASREEGQLIAAELLEKAHLHPVGPLSNSSLKRKEARRAFCDDINGLYRFSSLKFGGGLDIEFDFSESSSDSDTEKEINTEAALGSVVKQGFLVKQGHVRHNWKVRKFVLRDSIPSLSYYIPTKTSKNLKGTISLQQSEVRALNLEEIDKENLWAKGSKKFIQENCFVVNLKSGKHYLLQAQSEKDRKDWVQAINDVIEANS